MVKHLRFAERNLVPSGLHYRQAVFRRFLAHVGNVPVEDLGPDHVEDYLLTRPTNHNFNKERTELLVLFSWALKRRLVNYNPVAAVDKLKVEKTKKVIPTPKEMAKILMAAGKDRPFLLVLFHTMARVDEVQRLKWEDVNFTETDGAALDPEAQGWNLGIRLAVDERGPGESLVGTLAEADPG